MDRAAWWTISVKIIHKLGAVGRQHDWSGPMNEHSHNKATKNDLSSLVTKGLLDAESGGFLPAEALKGTFCYLPCRTSMLVLLCGV